jgi:hypothetical protein
MDTWTTRARVREDVRVTHGRVVVACIASVVLTGCSAGGGAASPTATPLVSATASAGVTPSATGTSGTSAPTRPTAWLCRPGMVDNPCLGDLDTTVVAPDGSTSIERFAAAKDPAFDCFYVYPTVSTAKTRSAPLRATPEIVRTARAQASLFQRECRLFVPLYRQITLAGLVSGGFSDASARAVAQHDVEDAFREYLANDNDGRPFLLLGHSQGATVLTTLVQSDVDGNAALRGRLVSAMLIGGSPWLAPGNPTAGTFQNVPPCRSPTQVGCVVAYNTYDGAPPSGALFGRTTAGRTVICVNPGAPAGGTALLDPVVPRVSVAGDVVGFVEYSDSVRGACRATSAYTWLDARRVDGSRLPERTTSGGLGPSWGLHRVDVTVALGDLIQLAAAQASALR